MILDEPMEVGLSRPVKVSHAGDFVTVDTLVFEPPSPQMAREEDKMLRYFNSMQKEVAKFAADTAGPEAMQEAVAAKAEAAAAEAAGSEITALHKEYKDGDPEAKAEKLKQIEAETKAFLGFLDICTGVDFYQMSADFGKMVVNNKRCTLKGKNSEGAEVKVVMTAHIWEQQMYRKDRLNATIRYCCFFGLTSSTPD